MASLVDIKKRSPRWSKDVANVVTRRYALLTASRRRPPDFVVIGTKRGGTTSTFSYLTMHPGIYGLFPQSRTKKSSDYFFKHRDKGEDWYRSHFPTRAARERTAQRLGYAPVAGEASPYYMWDPRIARAAYEVNPELKAIALLRDPVNRAWSHYQERVANRVEPLSFEDALAAEAARTAGERERMVDDLGYYSPAHDWYSYRARGVYQPQLENWRRVFPTEQLLVLRSEDMYADVQGTYDRITDFLGVARSRLATMPRFGASRGGQIPPGPRDELTTYYAPLNAELESYLGRSLGWRS